MEPPKKHISRAWWLTPILILIIVWGVGHSTYVLTNVTNRLLAGFVTNGSSLSVSQVEGSVFGNVLVTGISVSSASDSTSVVIDSVQVSFSVLKAIQLHITSIKAGSITARISRNANGDFILPSFSPSKEGGSDFVLDALTVQSLKTQINQNDSLLVEISNGALDVTSLRIGSEFAVDVDTLWAQLLYPKTASKGLFMGSFAYAKATGLRSSIAFETEFSDFELDASFARDSVSKAFDAVDSLAQETIPRFPFDFETIASLQIVGKGSIASRDFSPFVPGLSEQEVYSLAMETVKAGNVSTTSGALNSLQSGTVSFLIETDISPESVKNDLKINFSNINPGASRASLNTVKNVFGSLNIKASGTSIESLEGTAILNLEKGSFDSLQFRPSLLNATFSKSLYDVDGTLRTNGGDMRITASYLEDGQFSAKGDLIGINLAELVQGQEKTSLNTAFKASGKIKDQNTSSGTLQLNIKPSFYSTCAIDSGRITASLSQSKLVFSTDVNICADSPFKSEGVIRRVFDNWVASATGSVSGLRVSEIISLESPFELSTSIDMTLASNGKVNGDVLLTDLNVGDIKVDSVRSSFKGNTKSLTIRPIVRLGGGTVSLDATITDGKKVLIRSGLIEHVDGFAIVNPDSSGVQTNSSLLNGTFSGQLNLEDEGVDGLFDLILENSRLNRQTLAGRSKIELNPEAAQILIDLQSQNELQSQHELQGSIEGRIVVDLNTSTLESNVKLNAFDPLPALNIDGSASLNGIFKATAGWTNELQFEGAVTLEGGSRFNEATFASLNASAFGGASNVSGSIEMALGRGDVRADYSWKNETLSALLRINDTDIAALLGINSSSSLSTDVEVYSNVLDETYSLRISQLEGYFETTTWKEGKGNIQISPSEIVIDSLLIPGTFGRFFANGNIPRSASKSDAKLAFELSLNHELSSLQVLKEYHIGLAELGLEGTLEGPFGATRLVSSFSARNLSSSSFSVDRISGRILSELDDSLHFSAAELTADLKLMAVGPTLAESGKLLLNFDGIDLFSDLNVDISGGRSFSTSFSWQPFDQPEIINIFDFSALLDGSQWSLAGASIVHIDRLYLEKPLVFSSGDQRIVAVSAPAGTNDAGEEIYRNLVTIQQLKIDPFADLVSYPELGGVLSGTLSSSKIGETVNIQGTLLGNITAYHQQVGTLNSQFTYDGFATRISARLEDTNGESIQLSGSIPEFSTDEQVQIHLTAESYSIDWIRSLLDPELVDALKGTINGEISISGTSKEPNWSGLLKVSDGQLGIPALGKRKGMVIQSIQGNFRFDGQVINVDSLHATSGDGWMRGSGTIDIRDLQLGEYNIALTAENFKAIDSPDYFGVVSGRMQLGGTTDRPRISGRITVHRGDFFLSDGASSDAFEPLALSDSDLATLQRRFGLRISATDTTSFDAYDVLALENFTVQMERDTWIRSKSNPKLDIQLTGDLDVRKKPKEDPEVFGSITILPERSRIIQFGKRFDLERGELTFNGPMASPNMNMEASYTVPSRGSETEEVTIHLIAQGTPDNLDVSFDSDPAMELADIFSYIATGRPAAASLQISGAQSDTYLQSAAGLAMGPVTDLIENLAGSGLGLDVIEIEHTGFSGLTLTAGKYVSPRLYVSVSQPITLNASSEASSATNKNQTQVTIEYELVQQLLLSLLNRGTILRVNFRWQHAF